MADEDLDDGPERSEWRSRAVAAALGLVFLGGLAWLVVSLSGGEKERAAAPQQIAVIRQPPPPPPPPPKPLEKPPEPPKVREEVKVDEPKPDEPKPADPKPADDKPASDKPLGLDADGSAGSDGFGLAANRGGRDFLGTGTGTVGGQGRYYTGLLQRNFFEALARSRQLPTQEFSVVVTIWLGDDGRVRRSEIVTSSGNPQIDNVVQATLAEMSALRELPPPNLRQVQLRLSRRA